MRNPTSARKAIVSRILTNRCDLTLGITSDDIVGTLPVTNATASYTRNPTSDTTNITTKGHRNHGVFGIVITDYSYYSLE